jgi:hypothetical protein
MDLRGEDDVIAYLEKSIDGTDFCRNGYASAELFHRIVRGSMSILDKFYVGI